MSPIALVIYGIFDMFLDMRARFKNVACNRKEAVMKSFQRKWEGLEITIITVIVLLLLLLAYLNWAIAILALIIVVAAYLVNYNTIHNRRRLAREQFGAMMKNVTQASNFALQNLPMGIALVNKQGTLVWNNSVFADWVKVDWNKLQKCLLLCLASVLIKSGENLDI